MADLMAGIIVGIVALPLAIAFGIASGVSLEKGIITAIIAGFIISALGGSRVQIGGPHRRLHRHRLRHHPTVRHRRVDRRHHHGRTLSDSTGSVPPRARSSNTFPTRSSSDSRAGIAVTIFTTQIKDLFGLTTPEMPADFLEKWGVYFQSFGTIDLWSTLVGVLSILIIVLTPRLFKKVPGSLRGDRRNDRRGLPAAALRRHRLDRDHRRTASRSTPRCPIR